MGLVPRAPPLTWRASYQLYLSRFRGERAAGGRCGGEAETAAELGLGKANVATRRYQLTQSTAETVHRGGLGNLYVTIALLPCLKMPLAELTMGFQRRRPRLGGIASAGLPFTYGCRPAGRRPGAGRPEGLGLPFGLAGIDLAGDYLNEQKVMRSLELIDELAGRGRRANERPSPARWPTSTSPGGVIEASARPAEGPATSASMMAAGGQGGHPLLSSAPETSDQAEVDHNRWLELQEIDYGGGAQVDLRGQRPSPARR